MAVEGINSLLAVAHHIDLGAHTGQNFLGDLGVDLVILGHQDAAAHKGTVVPAGSFVPALGRSGPGRALGHRQVQEH